MEEQTTCTRKYSKYYYTLTAEAQKRYTEKLMKLDVLKDPYTFSKVDINTSRNIWPNIEYPDIYNYLINIPSAFTKEEMKAYKSLEAYKYFVDGMVYNIAVHTLNNSRSILTASVKHSQRVNESPAKPWVAAEQSGIVLFAHCTCMAGLGEACSHIAALLFAAEANTRIKNSTSCTSISCSWLPPTRRTVEYAPVSAIDFTSPVKRRKIMLNNIENTPPPLHSNSAQASSSNRKVICEPSDDELDTFYQQLAASGKKSVILSLVPNYSDQFIPKTQLGTLPHPLTSFYVHDNQQMEFSALLEKCDDVFSSITITDEQSKNVELATRRQSESKQWYEQRAGRITASKFKAASHTRLSSPSLSLIRAICYPQSQQFQTEATNWGVCHEAIAIQTYMDNTCKEHMNFSVSKSGLVIDPRYPYLGASPDSIVTCDCCGRGVVEVKCPFSCRRKSFSSMTSKADFCLQLDSNRKFSLRQDHQYYYQVQAQMELCSASYCDFVVWRESEIVILRIKPDKKFIGAVINKITHYFRKVILPELLAKWYTACTK